MAVVALLALEGLARLVPESALERNTATGQTSQQGAAMVPHPTRIFQFVPNTSTLPGGQGRIDADGFRLPKVEGPTGAPVVITLGDSSVFGHMMSDGNTLHERLQVRMHEYGVAINALTAAQPGYSSMQELAVMDEAGWARKPALLVVATMWSDSHLDRYRDAEMVKKAPRPT